MAPSLPDQLKVLPAKHLVARVPQLSIAWSDVHNLWTRQQSPPPELVDSHVARWADNIIADHIIASRVCPIYIEIKAHCTLTGRLQSTGHDYLKDSSEAGHVQPSAPHVQTAVQRSTHSRDQTESCV